MLTSASVLEIMQSIAVKGREAEKQPNFEVHGTEYYSEMVQYVLY